MADFRTAITNPNPTGTVPIVFATPADKLIWITVPAWLNTAPGLRGLAVHFSRTNEFTNEDNEVPRHSILIGIGQSVKIRNPGFYLGHARNGDAVEFNYLVTSMPDFDIEVSGGVPPVIPT